MLIKLAGAEPKSLPSKNAQKMSPRKITNKATVCIHLSILAHAEDQLSRTVSSREVPKRRWGFST